MRVAVYDRHWSTAGGGERYAGGVAAVLAAAGHEVRLLSPEPLDPADLGERLQLDLSGVTVEGVGPAPEAVTRASADSDLFVNASHGSRDRSRAPRSLYVVFFPVQQARPPRRRAPLAGTSRRPAPVTGTAGRLPRSGPGAPAAVEVVDGVHGVERVAGAPVRWTDGRAVLDVPDGRAVTVVLARLQAPSAGDLPVEARLDGRVVAQTVVRPRRSRLDNPLVVLRLPPATRTRNDPDPGTARRGRRRLELLSPPWRPVDHGGIDQRVLGVALVAVVAGSAPGRLLQGLRHLLDAGGEGRAFLDDYSRILAVSAYTSGWIRRRWGRDSEVLHPPVVPQPRTAKRPVILGVGRFFDPGSGHGKRQRELVRAFRSLGAAGWELHLVGGCEAAGRSYLAEVRREAAGAAVELHVNASGAALRSLYGAASLFWHGAGLGEDPVRHPERFEHFGISTVEAMSAGAVPLVFPGGGQAELFEPGRAGYHWRTLDELVGRTRELIGDPGRRAAMANAAHDTARRFLLPVFAARLNALVDQLTTEGGEAAPG